MCIHNHSLFIIYVAVMFFFLPSTGVGAIERDSEFYYVEQTTQVSDGESFNDFKIEVAEEDKNL